MIEISDFGKLSALLAECAIDVEEVEILAMQGLQITSITDNPTRNERICHLIRKKIEQVGLPANLPVSLCYWDGANRRSWDAFNLRYAHQRETS